MKRKDSNFVSFPPFLVVLFPFSYVLVTMISLWRPFTKDVQLTPGEGVCGIRTFNCYLNVILLFYPDAGGGGLEILVLAGRPL